MKPSRHLPGEEIQMKWFTSFRRTRAFAFVVGFVLAAAAGALAFTIYTGLSGTPGGSFTSTVTNLGAISVTNNGTAPVLDAGTTIKVPVTLTVNPSGSEQVTSVPTATFTSTPSTCASHLMLGTQWYDSTGSPITILNSTYTHGSPVNLQMAITADATTPSTCASGTYTVNLSATTNP